MGHGFVCGQRAVGHFARLALEHDLDKYYFDNVIGGPGAVMVPAATYEAFADAIIKKLIIEIASKD